MTPKEIIKDIKLLISLPEAVIRANQLLDSPRSNATEIGEVISHDPALSAQLLKLVNSAFYNFPTQVDTVSRAITLIGQNELRSLIFASSTSQTFNQLQVDRIDIDGFWQRSVYCGLVAKKLANLFQEGSGEAMFLTGLFHDIGRLILFAHLPDKAQEIVDKSESTGRRFVELETEILGFSVAELGAALLENWHLPNNMWEPIRDQRQPEKAVKYSKETEILHLALQLTDCVEPEHKKGQPLDLEQLPAASIDGIELTTEQLNLLATEADLESFEVLAIVNPSATMIY